MNAQQTHEDTLMKPSQLPPACTVQSVTDQTGRRTVKLSRIAPHPDYARRPSKRRKAPFRLHLMMAPESAYSFEPTIQVRSQSKP